MTDLVLYGRRSYANISLWVRMTEFSLDSVAHWHSERWAWNGYQPGLGSIPRPGWI